MTVYSVTFRFLSLDSFEDQVTGEVKIIAEDVPHARDAFRATHTSVNGVHKIDSVRPSSL
jgi:hypothetical protein